MTKQSVKAPEPLVSWLPWLHRRSFIFVWQATEVLAISVTANIVTTCTTHAGKAPNFKSLPSDLHPYTTLSSIVKLSPCRQDPSNPHPPPHPHPIPLHPLHPHPPFCILGGTKLLALYYVFNQAVKNKPIGFTKSIILWYFSLPSLLIVSV